MRSEDGQASLEYLGLVALLALVLGALAVPALAGQDVAGGVLAQMRRALCIVSHGDCEEDRRPCAVATHGVRESQHANVAIFRYGRDRLTLREERSDGTVAVTVLKDHRFGLDVGVGIDAHLGSQVLGASVRGALLARLGSGSTTVFPNAREAERGMALLAEGRRPPGVTRERILRGGIGAELDAVRREGTAHVASDLIAGRSVDEATGRTTYVLRGSWQLSAALELPRLSGSADAAVDVAITLAREHGRFVDLGVAATGQLHGSASLPAVAGPITGMLPSDAAGGRRWALEQHLDLTDPDNRAAASAFIGALAHPREVPSAAKGLAERLVTRGITDVRAYALETEDDGAGVHVGAGGRLGAAADWHSERTRLLAALQRGPDGIWRRRADCLAPSVRT